MKYLYGPVQSRRLGNSLGITLTPYKTCNFDCVYCQLGKARCTITHPAVYVRAKAVALDFSRWAQQHPQIVSRLDYVTISGYGEPTLNTELGSVVGWLKDHSPVPVAVITNSSRLSDPDVRKQLLRADLIVPSLDAADEKTFKRLDRPAVEISLAEIVEGLVCLRHEFKGKIWLEVMIVQGINDSLEHGRKLKRLIEHIAPDKIQLNSPARSTSEMNILPASRERLDELRQLLGEKAEIV